MTSLEDTIKRYDMMSQRIDRQFEPLKRLTENSALASVQREQAAITAALGNSLIAQEYKTAYDLTHIPALEESKALSRRIKSLTKSVSAEALPLDMQYKSLTNSALSLYSSIGANLEFFKSATFPSNGFSQQVSDLATRVQNICLRTESIESYPPLRVESEVSIDNETADIVAEVISASNKSSTCESQVLPIIRKKMSPKELLALILTIIGLLWNIGSGISSSESQNQFEQKTLEHYKIEDEIQEKRLTAIERLADQADRLSSSCRQQSEQIFEHKSKRPIDRNDEETQSNFIHDKNILKPSD